MTFKIGDKVIGVGEHDSVDIEGLEGTIITDIKLSGSYGVEFETNIEEFFHGCNGAGKEGYCYWIPPDKLELTTKPTFTFDGPSSRELPPGYIRDEDGFITNPNNWKPGNWLI